jgi:hypothetical protein
MGGEEHGEPSTPPLAGSGRWGLLALAAALAAGLWLYAPTLDAGLHTDDYLHLAELEGLEPLPDVGPFGLFTFAQGRTDRMGPVQGDYLPWWTDPELKIEFMRPVPCLLWHLDWRLWGSDARGWHLSTLILWGVLLALVVRLYHELARDEGEGMLAVVLAGLLFALDRAHLDAISWIAGRYALVGAVFAVLGIRAWHRWRRNRGGIGAVLLWTALALLSGENNVVLPAWYLAHEVCLGRSPWRDRLRALVPVTLLVAAYLLARSALGYGAARSGFYVDPFERPLDFLALALHRLPQASRDLLGSTDWLRIHHPGTEGWVALGVGALILIYLLTSPLARFYALGASVSLVPLAAATPSQRILLVPSIASAWLIGGIAARALGALRRGPSNRVAWLAALPAALALLWLHGWVEPVTARWLARAHAGRNAAELATALDAELPPAGEDDARVLVIGSRDPMQAWLLPVMRLQQGRGWPGGVWPITFMNGAHLLERTGPRSLSISAAGTPGLLDSFMTILFRERWPTTEGERFELGALQVEIQSITDGRVRRIGLTLDRDLDDPGVWIVAWDGSAWRRVRPPGPGEKLRIGPG